MSCKWLRRWGKNSKWVNSVDKQTRELHKKSTNLPAAWLAKNTTGDDCLYVNFFFFFLDVTMQAIIVAGVDLLNTIFASPVREDPVTYLILYGQSVSFLVDLFSF